MAGKGEGFRLMEMKSRKCLRIAIENFGELPDDPITESQPLLAVSSNLTIQKLRAHHPAVAVFSNGPNQKPAYGMTAIK